MSVATILKNTKRDGVFLVLTDHGTLRVRGEKDALSRWLPAVRDHKPEIVEWLSALSVADENHILRWLAHIQETDQEIISFVIDKCRTDATARAYFLDRATQALHQASNQPDNGTS
jgi:hypothetical protein